MHIDKVWMFNIVFRVLRRLRTERVKERKSPARGDFTPSEMAAGRSRFGAQGSSALCGARLKKLFGKSFCLLAGTESFKSFFATVDYN